MNERPKLRRELIVDPARKGMKHSTAGWRIDPPEMLALAIDGVAYD